MMPLPSEPRGRVDRRGAAAQGGRWATLVVAALLLAGTGGCGEDAFLPPPSADLKELRASRSSSGSVTTQAPTIELIFAGGESPERALWETAARQEAGRLKAILHTSRPDGLASSSAQASVIRQAAVGQKPRVLVVEPADHPDVLAALEEVRAGGTPVVTLGKKLTPHDPGRTFASVTFSAFDEAARRVTEGLANASKARAFTGETALIVYNSRSELDRDAQIASLTKRFHEAGVADVQTLAVSTDEPKENPALTDRIRKDSRLYWLVGLDDVALNALIAALNAVVPDRVPELAGFATITADYSDGARLHCAVLVDRALTPAIRDAVQLAYGLARGDAVETDAVVPRQVEIRKSILYKFHTPRPSSQPMPKQADPEGRRR